MNKSFKTARQSNFLDLSSLETTFSEKGRISTTNVHCFLKMQCYNVVDNDYRIKINLNINSPSLTNNSPSYFENNTYVFDNVVNNDFSTNGDLEIDSPKLTNNSLKD